MEVLPDVETLTESEIRQFLYQYAKENDIEVTEFRDRKKSKAHWVHLQRRDDLKTTTAIGPNQNAALFMAFLNFHAPRCNFVPKEFSRRRKNT